MYNLNAFIIGSSGYKRVYVYINEIICTKRILIDVRAKCDIFGRL